MFFDYLDGTLARKLDVESDFGRELDSISDIVSFGVAPGIIAWKVFPGEPGFLLYFALITYLVSSAYRLARYNIGTCSSGFFRGLPITTGGGILALSSLYMELLAPFLILIIVFILSLTMISNIPYLSLKAVDSHKVIILILLLFIFVLSFYKPFILGLVLTSYYLSGFIILAIMKLY